MKRVFKAPFIDRIAPVDARCAFFDAIAAVVMSVGVEAGTAATIATVAGDALIGAGLGAGQAAITGGDIGQGALFGGLTGGAGGAFSAAGGVGGLFGDASGAGAAGVQGASQTAAEAAAGQSLGTSAIGASATGATAGGVAGISADPGSLASTAGSSDPMGAGVGLGGTTPTSAAGSAPAALSVDPGAAGQLPSGVSPVGPLSEPGAGNLPGISSGGGGGFSDILGKAGGYLEKNPGTALSALSLGKSILGGQQQPTAMKNLGNLANSQGAQSQQLESYLQSGTLPPGTQEQIDLATRNAEATIRSRYAGMGQSGSSAEANDIANARLQAAGQGQQIAVNLLQQGISEANLSGQLFAEIMNLQNQQNGQVSSAIGNFANAIGGTGSRGGININLNGQGGN
jgi:hypothetical protein